MNRIAIAAVVLCRHPPTDRRHIERCRNGGTDWHASVCRSIAVSRVADPVLPAWLAPW